MPMPQTESHRSVNHPCNVHEHHAHQHGEGCGHKPVQHDGHVDYEHDGHLHRMHGAHVDECGVVTDTRPAKLAGLLHAWTTPTKITYRHTAPSTALTALIHQQVLALEEFKDRIVECRIVIDEPNQHHRAKRFRVEVILLVPGAELIASADPSVEIGQDAYAAVHEAFHAIRRQLVDHLQRGRTHQS